MYQQILLEKGKIWADMFMDRVKKGVRISPETFRKMGGNNAGWGCVVTGTTQSETDGDMIRIYREIMLEAGSRAVVSRRSP